MFVELVQLHEHLELLHVNLCLDPTRLIPQNRMAIALQTINIEGVANRMG